MSPNWLKELKKQELGLTPIVSTVLLIGVFTVAIGAAGILIKNKFSTETYPLADFGNFRAESSGSGTKISFFHQGGKSISPSKIKVIVSGKDSRGINTSTVLKIESESPLKLGDKIVCSTPSDGPYYPQKNKITISVNHKASGKTLAKGETTVLPPGAIAPIASFDYSPSPPRVGEEVLFDGTDSYDPSDNIASYEWDFDDGSTGSNSTVTHIYSSPGIYSVTLTVTDNEGLSSSEEKDVNVRSGRWSEIESWTGTVNSQ